jgi:hypothetical protein
MSAPVMNQFTKPTPTMNPIITALLGNDPQNVINQLLPYITPTIDNMIRERLDSVASPAKKAEPNEGIAALLSLSDHIFTQDVRSKILANPEAVHHALNSHADKIKSISEDIKSLLSL